MLRTILRNGLLASAAVVLAVSAYAIDIENLEYPRLNDLKTPDIEEVTLDNGIRLYIIEDESLPVLNVSVRINAGSYLEPADKVGLASITGQVMRTGGTEKWTGDEIDEALEQIGGTVETSIGQLSGNAFINILSDYTDLGLEVLAEVLRRPVFDEDKIDLAKVGARSGISRRNDNATGIASREFSQVIYGDESVYARNAEYATIDAITRDDLIAFHQQWVQPEGLQMAIWGNVKKRDIVRKIEEYFGDWERGGVTIPAPPEVNYEFERKAWVVDKTDVTQANIRIGHIGGLMTDEDYADRIVMNNVLGGGFASRMFNIIRSKEGLAYGTFASYTANLTHPGVFIAYTDTKSESAGKAVDKMMEVIETMKTEPPTDEEMQFAKDGYLNSFVFNFDSKSEILNRMMSFDHHGLPRDFLQQTKQKVEQVTPEDVVAAAKRNLTTDKMHLLVVGKTADFDMPVSEMGFGPATEIDITIPTAEEQRELVISPENLQRGQEIIERAAETHGGTDGFVAIESISRTGTLALQTPNGPFPVALKSWQVFPNKSRSEISAMGATFVDITNDGIGWKTDQATMQVVAKSEDDLANDRLSERRNLIAIFKSLAADELTAVYDGSGTFSGADVDFVALVDETEEAYVRLAVAQETGQVMGKTFISTDPSQGGAVREEYLEIRDVNGVKIASKTARYLNGDMVAEITLEEVTVNGPIGDEMFSQPQ